MPVLFQISSEVNSGSVGRIAEQIGENAMQHGWESYIAYARGSQPSKSKVIRIGNSFDIIRHGVLTRLTDRHGFGSKAATKNLIQQIKSINPDIIQLQHLHGYFINIKLLFEFLRDFRKPVVWTFHDCWSFTGHCAHYEFIGCDKWETQCYKCPQTNEYPKSLFDNSAKNYKDKKEIFNSITNLTIVPVSNWLGKEVEKSFLKQNAIRVIQNGIDLEKFKKRDSDHLRKKYNLDNKFVILGVASPWIQRKGLDYFIQLSKKIDDTQQIILIGLDNSQISELPSNIIGVVRTENVTELAEFYSLADVFVNPTLEEALGLTNLEAQSCGTPVITFASGGSPETVDSLTGIVVEKGNLDELYFAIQKIKKKGKIFYESNCRARAEIYFDKNNCFKKYIELYKGLLGEK